MNIIGIAGRTRSGKDALAEMLIENDYFGVSLGDIVRNESRKRHASEPDPISVKNMTETANYLRTQHGADFALKQAIEQFDEAQKTKKYKGLVAFSVRAPVEADFILKNHGKLVWVEASDQIRHKRSVDHRRPGEPEQTLDEMLAQESMQEAPNPALPEEVQMNIPYIKSKATHIIENNGNDLDGFIRLASATLQIK